MVAKKPLSLNYNGNWRVGVFLLAVFSIVGLIIFRLFNLTFIEHQSLAQAAQSQYTNPSARISGRGNIYFSDLSNGLKEAVATNRSSLYSYVNPSNFTIDSGQLAKFSEITGRSIQDLSSDISDKNKSYMVIASDLSQEQAQKINALDIKGLSVASQVERFYPKNGEASNLLGFVGFNGNQRIGQYGLEAYYDNLLSGRESSQDFSAPRSYSGAPRFFKNIFKSQETIKDSTIQQGSDLVLTIDKNIQAAAEAKLEAVLKKWNSPAGSMIVENPKTGEIMAMASWPPFDPNQYGQYKLEDFINPNVQEVYEPGSSFKPITMAAALDTGSVSPETTYEDTGEIKVGGFNIRNFDNQAHGVVNMRQVLEKSLNTGAMFAQSKTGDDQFLNYVVNFGFGQKTDIDLTGEVAGNISNLYSGKKVNFATASFGQGIAVTPIQLINAYSAIANGGKMTHPHIVKEIINPDGSKTEIKPKIVDSPITEKTSRELTSMLVDVVDKGFDKARIKGYEIAGKTGTAQIPSSQGGYLGDNQFIHNFLGFAPANDPRFVILIKMDKPKGIKFAADSLSPVFGDMARFLIRYFNIPPTR